jgi:hypothetical protein
VSDLQFSVVGSRAEPYAAVPTLAIRLRIKEATGAEIQAIALRCLIQIEPRRRHYTGREEERLVELFGEPHRWGDTLKSVLWANTSMLVPAFTGSTEVDLLMPCTYDFEVASSKYFHALDDGEIPLLLLFSGTVFARAGSGFVVDQVPWHHEAQYRMPVRVWRDTMDAYFPDSAWLRVHRDTFDRLHRYKGRRAMPSWDHALAELLDAGESAERLRNAADLERA